MEHQIKYLHCGEPLKQNMKSELDEVVDVVKRIGWKEEFKVTISHSTFLHQAAYNKRFEIEFLNLGWKKDPKLSVSLRLKGDFRKNLVFVEIQFGNSATLYRDFYKFQYGHQNGLISLGVLIVPVKPKEFFPTRKSDSVSNMAEYDLALRYFKVLPISMPTMIIGLIAS